MEKDKACAVGRPAHRAHEAQSAAGADTRRA